MRWISFFLVALLALQLVPLGAAHAAPAPRDFETRLLHDHNDDSAYSLVGEHGFDTIALDVREGRLPDGQDALILRLLLNGGCNAELEAIEPCGELSLDVEFTATSGEKVVTYTTGDGGATWSGSAPLYVGPMGINDGTRFAIEAWMPMADLGIAEGNELSSWFVSAADNMPEGAIAGQPDPLESSFDIGTYKVGSASKYISLSSEQTNVLALPGDVVVVPIQLNNLLVENQIVTFVAEGATMEIDGETTNQVDLAANAGKEISLMVQAGSNNSVASLTAVTALGGYERIDIPVSVEAVDEYALTGLDVPAGSSWSHTFRTVGIFSYHNHHAAEISGKVIIEPASGSVMNHSVYWTGEVFDPSELTIHVGDTVTWFNNGTADMMVMGGVTADGTDPQAHMHDHEHGEEGDSKGIPAPALPLLAFGLLALAFRRR